MRNFDKLKGIMMMSVVATAVAVFLITALGALLRKKGRLSDAVDSSFMWLMINILYPSLILNSILKNPALDNVENIFLPPIMGFTSMLIALGLSALLYRFVKLNTLGEKKSYLLSNSLNNYGFLPIPIILALYSKETLGVLFVHNIGVDLAIWSLGIFIISSHLSMKDCLKKVVNVPLCTVVVSLFLTYFDLDTHMPEFVFKTSQLLGQAAIPVALLLVGSLMYDAQKTVKIGDGWRLILSAVAIRLVLFPVCYIGLAWLIPMSVDLQRVMLVEAAQPAAMLPIILARQYHASAEVAYVVMLSTSLASLVTMPLWIHYGTLWLF
ncbi:MAG: AEC family transporter [Verrucomicrobia bacterium]|nr:AEC family transporter [Verrucomicrobiota bacterium]